MSLQWTFIATFLYTEIFLTVLLLLPFISAYRWSRIFHSRLLTSFRAHANIYFNIFIVVLLILFCDAIREVRKYSGGSDQLDMNTNPQAETLIHMKLFRAQRNFYIAGFALFLFLVLRRLVTLICDKAQNEAQVEALKRQAESATATAKKLLEDTENKVKANEKEEKTAVATELENTKKSLKKAEDEIQKTKKDFEAMKKQAEATNNEYDRLAEENRSLQKKMEKMEGESGTKKEN